ncbi:hypothetical protein M569_00585 [Genlisea aurea]|uniref:VQ domain-containing protein n=1 Tax=Genlisea aurea TaxID=192259 RepID=S8D430_9LAMI|nr:hypothetical protein M569_00585 [Genlisea aurea]
MSVSFCRSSIFAISGNDEQMNFPEFPSGAGRSPRRELLGPRPTPLKVSKDSHKIRKPPVAPQQPAALPRPPVIIYTVSPKVIHADPSEFMSLVQRLTCPDSTYDGTVSPAARFASIERTRRQNINSSSSTDHQQNGGIFELGIPEFVEQQRLPGILSPNPNSLLPISRNIFSPPPPPPSSSSHQTNQLFHDFSPALLINSRSFNENSGLNQFFLSPSSNTPFLLSPQFNFNSPNALDLFRSLFDS